LDPDPQNHRPPHTHDDEEERVAPRV